MQNCVSGRDEQNYLMIRKSDDSILYLILILGYSIRSYNLERTSDSKIRISDTDSDLKIVGYQISDIQDSFEWLDIGLYLQSLKVS